MHPVTLHAVGVITKLYFAIFAAFKESMALNLAQESFKVIDFSIDQKCVCIFLLVVDSNLEPILHRFRNTAVWMSKIDNFPYPNPIHCYFSCDFSVIVIVKVIIFQVFQLQFQLQLFFSVTITVNGFFSYSYSYFE